MSIAKKSLIDYFAQNAGLVITFVAGILVARFFGKVGLGEYSLILLANLLLLLFSNMGIEISTRVFAGKNKDKVTEIHTAAVFVIVCISIITAIVLFFFHDWLRVNYFKNISLKLLALAAFLLPFCLYQLVWQGIMVGMGEIILYARFFMWNRIAQGGAVIILIAFTYPKIEWLIYIWVAIQLITFILSVIVIVRKYKLFGPLKFDWIKGMLSFGWIVHIGNIAANLIHKYIYLIISQNLGPGGVGLYSRAATFSDKITIIAGSLERATYEPATRADKNYAPLLIQKVFRYNLYVNFLGSVAMYIFGSVCIRMLLQEEFLESLYPLKFLLLSVVFMSCSRIIAIYFTAHLKKPVIPGIINWVVLPVSLVITTYFTKRWGLKGASIAIASIYFIHSLLFLAVFFIMNRRIIKFSDFFLFRIDDYHNIKKIILKR
jgi:O-antigen/teichoic acid export membrane protein